MVKQLSFFRAKNFADQKIEKSEKNKLGQTSVMKLRLGKIVKSDTICFILKLVVSNCFFQSCKYQIWSFKIKKFK